MAQDVHRKARDINKWSSQTEITSRTWWGLRSLECLLSSITGQPLAVPVPEPGMPLPTLLSPNYRGVKSVTMLQTSIKITIIAQWALSGLYSVQAATLHWHNIQDRVTVLRTELNNLYSELTGQDNTMLQFSWFDTMILITRPCLHIQKHTYDMPNEGFQIAKDVGKQCIQAARGVTQLLPNEPSDTMHRNGPWWCLTHYIMRAMAVLLVAMSAECAIEVADDHNLMIKKLVRWLQWLQPTDPVAHQGLKTILTTLQRSPHQAEYADILQQEAARGFDGFLLDSIRGQNSGTMPQFLNDFGLMDELMDPTRNLNEMLAQSQTGTLPLPRTYRAPFSKVDEPDPWAFEGF